MKAQLVQCLSLAPDSIPSEIQYLPPGTHTVWARKNGEPSEITVTVTAQTARTLQSSLEDILSAGEEATIDFDHAGAGPAAGWLESFSWAGDDPGTGGVRAKVRWTAAGEAALKGRDYRKFSPEFTVGPSGEINGTAVNAGALVNHPAFRQLTIAAAAASKTEKSMTDAEYTAALAAKDTQIATLQAAVTAAEARLADQAKANAKSLVTAAVADGRIPGQNTTLLERWTATLTADPSAAELLAAMPKQAALRTVVANKSQTATAVVQAASVEALRRKEVQAYQSRNHCTFDQAWQAVRLEKPELFQAVESLP